MSPQFAGKHSYSPLCFDIILRCLLFSRHDVIKILAVIAGLVLIVFPVWWLEKTAVPMPAYRKGGFADYAYLVYSLLAVYGSVLFGIAVQIVRAKRIMQPLYPFGLFKAGLGGVLAVAIAFFTIDAVYGLTRFGGREGIRKPVGSSCHFLDYLRRLGFGWPSLAVLCLAWRGTLATRNRRMGPRS
jgi:hypothetical protein